MAEAPEAPLEGAVAPQSMSRPRAQGRPARQGVRFIATGEPTRAALRAQIVKLAGPAIVEQFLVTLVQMIDMIMVSHLGAAATAAVGLTNQPIFLALAAFMALNVGTTAIVARSIGAGDVEQAHKAARQTLVITVIMGLGMAVAGYLSAPWVILAMRAGPDVLPLGVTFMRFIALSMIFSTFSMSLSAVLRGAGDTRTPMMVNVAANLVVIILDFLLIYGNLGAPRLGIAGAGVATLVARFIAAVLVSRAVFGGRLGIKLSLRDRYGFDRVMIGRILRIGLWAAAEQFIMRAGMILFVTVVAGLGTATYAAHQIAINIVGLSFMPGMGFAIAATTVVGQSLGQKRPDWAEKGAYETRLLGMGVATFMGVVFFFGAPLLMRMYTSDMEVVRQGVIALRIIALIQPAQSTAFILAGGLRGAGDTTWPVISTAIGVWGFRVFLSWVFVEVLHWGLGGAWWAMFADQGVRSIIIYYRFRSGRWKKVVV
ncbi:MAG: MATE family efflux transporter [Bacillota bacterium]